MTTDTNETALNFHPNGTMTSKERVARTFERRDVDRVPRYESFWGETIRRWMNEGINATDEGDAREIVHSKLGADMRLLIWCWPHPFPGREILLSEDAQTRTTMGPSGTIERNWKYKSGAPEHIGWDCSSRVKWETEYKPAFLNQNITVNINEARRNWAKAQRESKWTFIAGVEAFEELRKLIGDERTMYAFIDEPEWIADIAETQATVLLRNLQGLLDAGIQPDGLWLYGDMAFKNTTFCSPRIYRQLIWPQHKRIAEWVHQHGMKLIFHSDGDLRKVIDLHIDAGFDCLQPLESKANMDIRELAPKYGNSLCFFGNIDVMKLITNDLEIIEEEVRSKFAAGMASRGYIYHSDHSVPPQVSWRTYETLINLVNRFGCYNGLG